MDGRDRVGAADLLKVELRAKVLGLRFESWGFTASPMLELRMNVASLVGTCLSLLTSLNPPDASNAGRSRFGMAWNPEAHQRRRCKRDGNVRGAQLSSLRRQ